MPERVFKKLPYCELIKEAEIRQKELDVVLAEVAELRKQLKEKRKLEFKLTSRLNTVTHWIKEPV